MTLFSLIVPTRERLELLRSLLTSIEKTTYDPSSIEVFLVCDTDDTQMIQAIKPLRDEYSTIPLRFIIRQRETEQWVKYINETIPLTKGKFIAPICDDALFMTQHWDKKLLEKLENYLADKPDGIVYGRTYGGEEEWNKQQYFWHGKHLRFEVDITKDPPEINPYTDKIKFKKDGKKLIMRANPIVREGSEYQLLVTYVENKKLMVVYGKKEAVCFSFFPFISRKAIGILGHLFHSYINAQGADFAIGKVYMDIDRVLDLPEIEILHFRKTDDNVHEGMKKRSTDSNWFIIANLITDDVEKLKKHIELYKKINKEVK